MSHILAVDDDPDVLGTLERVLRREEFDVKTLDSGKKALAYLEDTKPDLLILDIIMPGMDGIEVCRRLKQTEDFNSIPIIFISARSSKEGRLEGLAAIVREGGAGAGDPEPVARAVGEAEAVCISRLAVMKCSAGGEVEGAPGGLRDPVPGHDGHVPQGVA